MARNLFKLEWPSCTTLKNGGVSNCYAIKHALTESTECLNLISAISLHLFKNCFLFKNCRYGQKGSREFRCRQDNFERQFPPTPERWKFISQSNIKNLPSKIGTKDTSLFFDIFRFLLICLNIISFFSICSICGHFFQWRPRIKLSIICIQNLQWIKYFQLPSLNKIRYKAFLNDAPYQLCAFPISILLFLWYFLHLCFIHHLRYFYWKCTPLKFNHKTPTLANSAILPISKRSGPKFTTIKSKKSLD